MAFVAPFLAPVIGSAIGGLAATAVGKAVIGIGLSLGASYLTKKAQKSDRSPTGGMRLSLRVGTNEARELPFGRVAEAGDLKYHHTYGPNGNDYVQVVYVFADVECDEDGLEKVVVNGEEVTLGSYVSNSNVSGYSVDEFPNAMWIEYHHGAFDQDADADLVAKSGGAWTANDRFAGMNYVRITMKSHPTLYKDGFPDFLFVYRGVKLYDWRKDSTAGGSGSHRWGQPETYEWTRNPIVAEYNYMRGIYVNGRPVAGMNTPAVALPLSYWTAEANACDEAVGRAGGGTEPRYCIDGVIDVGPGDHLRVLRDMQLAYAGDLVDSGGVFRPLVGIARSSVMTITDNDLLSGVDVEYVPKLSRANLVNAVFGEYHDPDQMYEPVALPPRISPADELNDNGLHLPETYAFGFITSNTQGQRVMEIFRRRGRYQRTITVGLRCRFAVLEAGDWVTWSSTRYGFVSTKWEVVQATLQRDMTVQVVLRETANGIYAWTPAEDELDPDNPATVGAGGSTFTTVQGLAVANVVLPGIGTEAQIPALQATWTPVTDATVTNLRIEYREVGQTVALEKIVQQPDIGELTWTEGIQGGLQYEIRALPITTPPRAVTYTGWVSAPDTSEPHVVDVAASVPDGTITLPMLSPQTAHALSLVTAGAEVQGSVQAAVQDLYDTIQEWSAAMVSHQAQTAEAYARVTQEIVQRVTDREAFAAAITEVVASINGTVAGAISGLEARVTETEEGQTAAEARAYLQVAVDGAVGKVSGGIDLYANALFSIIQFLADKVVIAKPDGSGATQIFTVGDTPSGTNRVAINGDLLVLGSILATHLSVGTLDAIAADIGVITAGRLQNHDNTTYFDLGSPGNPPEFQMTF